VPAGGLCVGCIYYYTRARSKTFQPSRERQTVRVGAHYKSMHYYPSTGARSPQQTGGVQQAAGRARAREGAGARRLTAQDGGSGEATARGTRVSSVRCARRRRVARGRGRGRGSTAPAARRSPLAAVVRRVPIAHLREGEATRSVPTVRAKARRAANARDRGRECRPEEKEQRGAR